MPACFPAVDQQQQQKNVLITDIKKAPGNRALITQVGAKNLKRGVKIDTPFFLIDSGLKTRASNGHFHALISTIECY